MSGIVRRSTDSLFRLLYSLRELWEKLLLSLVIREEVIDRDPREDESSELKWVISSGYDRIVSILQFRFVWRTHGVDDICSRMCHWNFVRLVCTTNIGYLRRETLLYVVPPRFGYWTWWISPIPENAMDPPIYFSQSHAVDVSPVRQIDCSKHSPP